MSALALVWAAMLMGLAGVLGATLLPHAVGRRAGFVALLFAALLALAGGAQALVLGTAASAGWPASHLITRVDPLAAFFVVVIGGVALAVAIFAFGGAAADENGTGCTTAAAACLTFVASILIVAADDAWLFIFAWELLAAAFYWGIGFAGRARDAAQASYLTAVVTHAAGAGLVAALLMLARSAPSFALPDVLGAANHVSAAVRAAAFVLFVLAFGAKIGAIPLQLWLPRGYPSAPSTLAALMAGGALNVGFYGIIRFLIAPHWPTPLWWGVLLMVVGAFGAIAGISWAAAQPDMRALAAYSSIENAGLIMVALGAALAAQNAGLHLLVGMALAAAFMHIAAHAAAKSLLFLGSAAVEDAAGGTSFQALGGLMRRMPITSTACTVAALSLAALPPQSGFVSEWLILETLMQAFRTADVATEVVFALCGATVGVAAGIAVVAFVKYVGIGFLGAPRSAGAASAREAAWPRGAALVSLAAMTLGLGLFARAFLALAAPAIDAVAGAKAVAAMLRDWPLVGPSFAGFSSISPFGLAAMLLGFGLFFAALVAVVPRPAARRVGVWTSGDRFRPWTQYTGTGFANPTRVIADALVRTQREVERFGPPLAPHAVRYASRIRPFFDLSFARRIAAPLLAAGDAMRATQSGKIASYLSYIMVFVILALIFYPAIRHW